jgi:hypothetical protein
MLPVAGGECGLCKIEATTVRKQAFPGGLSSGYWALPAKRLALGVRSLVT